MRTFKDRGFAFYFLELGEALPNIYAKGDFTGGYVIWPREIGKWDIRYKFSPEWERITDRLFDTEQEAFAFAFEHYTNRKPMF